MALACRLAEDRKEARGKRVSVGFAMLRQAGSRYSALKRIVRKKGGKIDGVGKG
jgi:hypothetical protein